MSAMSFNSCGQRMTLQNDNWEGEPKTELVLIGRNLDHPILRQQLQDCLVVG